jgi:hypothetical protein
LSVLSSTAAGYLDLIFSAAALAEAGSIYTILANSNQYAVALGKRLREKVYSTIVPTLRRGSRATECARIWASPSTAPAMTAPTSNHATHLLSPALPSLCRGSPPFAVWQQPPNSKNISLNRIARKFAGKSIHPSMPSIHPSIHARSHPSIGASIHPDDAVIWASLQGVWQAIDQGNLAWDIPASTAGYLPLTARMAQSLATVSSQRSHHDPRCYRHCSSTAMIVHSTSAPLTFAVVECP